MLDEWPGLKNRSHIAQQPGILPLDLLHMCSAQNAQNIVSIENDQSFPTFAKIPPPSFPIRVKSSIYKYRLVLTKTPLTSCIGDKKWGEKKKTKKVGANLKPSHRQAVKKTIVTKFTVLNSNYSSKFQLIYPAHSALYRMFHSSLFIFPLVLL